MRAIRLGFEAFLIALCGYLIGVGGLPPLFDAPGSGQDQRISSTEAADGPAAGADDAATEQVATVDPLPGAGVTVAAGRATWTSGYFQAALFKALLEELGYEVTEPAANELDPTEAFTAMAGGTIQFWPNTWLPNHAGFQEAEMPDGSQAVSHLTNVGNLLPSAGLEGIVITTSAAVDSEISSLQQINDDPDLVALFDADGNGRADVHGCPPDWGCWKILDETITFNSWENLEQIAPENYADDVAGWVERVEGDEPMLIYTWSPSGYLTKLRPGDNVLWVDLGGQDKVLDGSITADFDYADLQPPALGQACTNDPCYLGWPAADILVTAESSFLEANPSARVLFEQVQLEVLDVALAAVKYDSGESTEADVARHAQEWIAENRPTVDAWLEAARAAG